MAGRGGQRGAIAPLLEQADARRRGGRLEEARVGFADAAKAAEAAGDASSFVTAALGVGGIWVHEQRDVVARAALESLWSRARSLVAAGSVEEARLAVRRASEAVYEGAPVEEVMAAVERVRASGDEAATAEALSLLHHVQLGPRYAEGRLALAEEILSLGARAQDALLTLMGLCWRTVDLFLLGDTRAGQSLEELRERSEAQSCEALGFVSEVLLAMLLARAGRFEETEALASRAVARGTATGDPDAPAYYGAMLGALRWWQGREKEVIDLVRAISTSPRLGFNDNVYVAADALLSSTLGDLERTEEALARLAAVGLDRLPHSSSWLTTVFLVAETAYLLGDASLAAAAGELLAPYAHLPVMPSLAVVCFGSVERAWGCVRPRLVISTPPCTTSTPRSVSIVASGTGRWPCSPSTPLPRSWLPGTPKVTRRDQNNCAVAQKTEHIEWGWCSTLRRHGWSRPRWHVSRRDTPGRPPCSHARAAGGSQSTLARHCCPTASASHTSPS